MCGSSSARRTLIRVRAGTWTCCSGCGSSTARGMRTTLSFGRSEQAPCGVAMGAGGDLRLGRGHMHIRRCERTWTFCGGRVSATARGKRRLENSRSWGRVPGDVAFGAGARLPVGAEDVPRSYSERATGGAEVGNRARVSGRRAEFALFDLNTIPHLVGHSCGGGIGGGFPHPDVGQRRAASYHFRSGTGGRSKSWFILKHAESPLSRSLGGRGKATQHPAPTR